MAISIGVSFALTWVFGYKDEEPQAQKKEQGAAPVQEGGVGTASVQEQGAAANGELVLYAPIQGKAIPREEIPDEKDIKTGRLLRRPADFLMPDTDGRCGQWCNRRRG